MAGWAIAFSISPSPGTLGEGGGEGLFRMLKAVGSRKKTLTLSLSQSTRRGDKSGNRRQQRRLRRPNAPTLTLMRLLNAITMQSCTHSKDGGGLG